MDDRLDSAVGEQGLRRILGHRALGEGEFLGAVGGLHGDLEHEPVFLRFRQRVGAFVFDRVLRGEDGEVRRQRVVLAINGHHPFLHRLQQGGLRLGRRAVDFVGQQERGEDRPFDEGELVALQVEDIGAGDVGRHEVGGELDAGEVAAQHPGQRAHEQGFGDAGHALDERMVAGEDGDERLFDHRVLADDDFAGFPACLGENVF